MERQLEKIVQADQRIQEHLPPVLIQGETGTGKTTIARWLHHRGPRSGAPLVEVNCSALPDSLAESELFGHERGAFTDARTARMGLFEAANGGTLFLDELPSLSPLLQAKVLKALEDHRIRRLGGNRQRGRDHRGGDGDAPGAQSVHVHGANLVRCAAHVKPKRLKAMR